MCVCLQAHSTTFDWISQRETATLSAPPPLVTACIIDPEQLHFLSVSKLIRCSAFTQPGLIPPSSSFLCNPNFPPICLCLSSPPIKILLNLCRAIVFFMPLCIFLWMLLSYLNLCQFLLIFFHLLSDSSILRLSFFSSLYCCEHHLCQSLVLLSLSLCYSPV